MMKPRRRKYHNTKHIRTKQSYTIEEIAEVLNTHKNTIRLWIKEGLHVMDECRPYLIHGAVLKAFLAQRQKARKQPCQHGEIYCFTCRAPRRPWEGMVDVQIISQKIAQMIGVCSVCNGKLNRRTSVAKLEEHQQHFNIQQLDTGSIAVHLPPSLHCYLTKEDNHDEIQPKK